MASGLKRLDVLKKSPGLIRSPGLNQPNDLGKLTKEADICHRLKARNPNFIHHKLSSSKSTPYQLLETALSKFLPISVNQTLPQRSPLPPTLLPAGYHLVHFPPPTLNLLDDGTDDVHFPGKPWVRRMWAGGSIDFRTDERCRILTCRSIQPNSLSCHEQIKDAVVKGNDKNKKVWVDIRRVIVPRRIHNTPALTEPQLLGQAAITERRNLVFMRAKTPQEAIDDVSKATRTIKCECKSLSTLNRA